MDWEDYKTITREHLWKFKSSLNILAQLIPGSWLVIEKHEVGERTLAICKNRLHYREYANAKWIQEKT